MFHVKHSNIVIPPVRHSLGDGGTAGVQSYKARYLLQPWMPRVLLRYDTVSLIMQITIQNKAQLQWHKILQSLTLHSAVAELWRTRQNDN